MDIDTAKENIQPLRQGRRADRLETALFTEKEFLDQERKQYEDAIANYEGADPLSPWYEYTCWIEQSYPQGNHSVLNDVISKCLFKFEKEPRYKQDRRLIKLFIKYIDTQSNPQELYSQLYAIGTGTMVADLYIAWSHYYDAVNDFKRAEAVFQKGIDAGAQPYDELIHAHQSFSVSMSRRLIYNDDESQKKFQASIEEKRSALTSLRVHKKKFVGSVRTGNAIMNENPGRILSSTSSSSQQILNKITVLEDDGNVLPIPNPESLSIVGSIMEGQKAKNENFLEPGTWSKIKMSKCGKVAASSANNFEIMEDDFAGFPKIECTKNLYELGAQLPPDFVKFNKPQSSVNDFPIIILDDKPQANVIACYEKHNCYPNGKVEISPEELRGFRWFKNKNQNNAPVIQAYSNLLIKNFESGVRLYPGFLENNIIKESEQKFPSVLDESTKKNLQVKISEIFKNGIEYSTEEILAEKFQRGEIKLISDDDFEESISGDVDMELTLIGDRRQSIYPASRKSFVPRKSILRKSILPKAFIHEEDEVEELHQQNQPRVRFEEQLGLKENLPEVREEKEEEEEEEEEKKESEEEEKLSLKRKLSTPDKGNEAKNRFVAKTPTQLASLQPVIKESIIEEPQEVFKPPLPVAVPERRSFRPFELDDEETFCSTQQFNLFVKATSVSTPNTKKSVPRLVPLPSTAFSPPTDDIKESSDSSEDLPINNTENHQQQMAMMPNKLSVIMEVTETTQSTKSSCYGGENDTEFHPKTPKSAISHVINEDGLKFAFDFQGVPEDQTETIPFNLKSIKMTKVCESSVIIPVTSPKSPTISTIPIPTDNDEENEEVAPKNIEKNESMLKSQQLPSTSICIPKFDIFTDSMMSHIEIPATQEFERSHIELPATQEMISDIPAGAPEHMDQSTKNLSSQRNQLAMINYSQNNAVMSMNKEIEREEREEEKTKEKQGFQFSIYEDSFYPPQASLVKTDNNNESKMFHMSCKENVPSTSLIPQQQIVRSSSDELLTLCSNSPPVSNKTSSFIKKSSNIDEVVDDDISDLLKLSGMKNLEGDFKALELNNDQYLQPMPPPKSASPTMIFEDDLNTEKFKFPLVGGKNSTLLFDVFQKNVPTKAENDNVASLKVTNSNAEEKVKLFKVDGKSSLEVSIEMDDEESQLFPPITKKNEDAIFKIPEIPVLKPPPQQQQPQPYKHNATPFQIFEDDFADDITNTKQHQQIQESKEVENVVISTEIDKVSDAKDREQLEGNDEIIDDDMSTTIYFQNFVRETPEEENDESGEHQSWEDEKLCSFIGDAENCYELTLAEIDENSLAEREALMKVQNEIEKSNGNPFSESLRRQIIEHCKFEKYLREYTKECVMLKNIPKLKKGLTLEIGDVEFKVMKFIAKGSFGSIYAVQNAENREVMAAKQEKPPNLWEYFICMELTDRLRSKNIEFMQDCFMNVSHAIIANNSSILISNFSPFGTIIDVCNKIRKVTGRSLEEFVGIVWTSQMLSIVDFLHGCHIIHGDVKPDNFLVMAKINLASKVPALQLIDFGSAIDMDVYSSKDQFTYVVKTENFTCCEMLDNRPWTYQTDLFGIVGTAHVLLFGKYMKVQKRLGRWETTTSLPRYFKVDLWHKFFDTLLNIPDSFTLPNLQELKQKFNEEITVGGSYFASKIDAFNRALLS